ncbi:MFS transporter [Haladaptatus sp. QDMS2]|uniref:MFS transporter n=2 Tax=unclassified Haladaptatus TaxID=2622732 RepID=UPI0023E7F37E|nr:MFS transporter [Haladaptatus sp. QDMS2]
MSPPRAPLGTDESSLVVSLVGGSHFVNHMYLMLLPPAFALLGPVFSVSTAQLGLAVGVLGAVVTLLQLPYGYLSDAHSRTLVLSLSLGFGALGAFLAAIAPTYEWLLVSQVVLGIGVAGHHPAHYPLLAAATTEGKRGRAYSVHGFTGALGLAAPFALVPLALVLGFGWREAFLAIALFGGLYAVVCLGAFARYVGRDVTHPPAEASKPDAIAPSFASELRTLITTPVILLLTTLWFVSSLAAWGVRTYSQTLLAAGYGFAPADASLASSAMLAVGAGFILLGGWVTDRTLTDNVLLAGYGALAVLAAVLASGSVPVLLALALVLVLASTIDVSRPARAKLTDRASARKDVGKNFALMTIGISAGGAIGPPVFGYVIDVAGVGLAFYLVAALAAVAVALALAIRSVSAAHDTTAPTTSE